MNLSQLVGKYRGRSLMWYVKVPLFVLRLLRRFLLTSSTRIFRTNAIWFLKTLKCIVLQTKELDSLLKKQHLKILWVRLDHIGDVVMNFPAIDAVCTQFPSAQVDLLVLPGSRDVVIDFPYIHEVMTYASPRFYREGRKASFFETLTMVVSLRKRKYDVVIESRGDDTARLFAFLIGAPVRIGPVYGTWEDWRIENFSFLMTHPVVLRGTEDVDARSYKTRSLRQQNAPVLIKGSAHIVDNNLFLLEPLKIEPPSTFRFSSTSSHREKVLRKLQKIGGRPIAIVHASNFCDPKRSWGADRFAEIVDHLVLKHDFTVLLTGSPKDHACNEEILKLCSSPRCFNIAGTFSLRELPALFENASFMVTVDTGPMHLAAMVGTPMVALVLPHLVDLNSPYLQGDCVVTPPGTRPQVGLPMDVSILPSLRDIPIEQVKKAIDSKLSRTDLATLETNLKSRYNL